MSACSARGEYFIPHGTAAHFCATSTTKVVALAANKHKQAAEKACVLIMKLTLFNAPSSRRGGLSCSFRLRQGSAVSLQDIVSCTESTYWDGLWAADTSPPSRMNRCGDRATCGVYGEGNACSCGRKQAGREGGGKRLLHHVNRVQPREGESEVWVRASLSPEYFHTV